MAEGPREHVKFDAGRKKKAKPKFKLSQRKDDEGSRLWVVLGVIAVIGLVAYAMVNAVARPDPHYVAARNLVERYEGGRAATDRNYNNPIYQQALEELDLVDPESISAEPAAELRDAILSGREAFLAQRAQTTSKKASDLDKHARRTQLNHEAYRRARANPVTEYKECEKEEGDGHSH